MDFTSCGVGVLVAATAYAQTSKWQVLKALVSGGAAFAVSAAMRCFSRAVFGLQRELFPIEEYVAGQREEIEEPDLVIVDAHHHLLDPRTQDKGWPIDKVAIQRLYRLKPKIVNWLCTKDTPVLRCSFGERSPNICPYMGKELTDDIRDVMGNRKGHNVVATVYVECGWHTPGVEKCMEPVKEADMVVEVNRQFPGLCNAMVAFADLRLGAGCEPTLTYYKNIPLVKGIRHSLTWSDDKEHLVDGPAEKDTAYDPKFREGFALLLKYGYFYEAWLYHLQIDALADLARSFPDTVVVCNHIGFPLGNGKFNKEETWPVWKESMKRLAECPNVLVKIGGFGMRTMGFKFDERPQPAGSDELAEAWSPYIRYVIDTFGVDRCMMESNFPMDKVTCSYTVLWNALKKSVRDLPLEDKRKLFELNARKLYGL